MCRPVGADEPADVEGAPTLELTAVLDGKSGVELFTRRELGALPWPVTDELHAASAHIESNASA
jgi:hypothetical protein